MLTLGLDSFSPALPGRLSLPAYFLLLPYRRRDLHEVLVQEEVAEGTIPVPALHNVADLAEGGERHADGAVAGCTLALPGVRSENR